MLEALRILHTDRRSQPNGGLSRRRTRRRPVRYQYSKIRILRASYILKPEHQTRAALLIQRPCSQQILPSPSVRAASKSCPHPASVQPANPALTQHPASAQLPKHLTRAPAPPPALPLSAPPAESSSPS